MFLKMSLTATIDYLITNKIKSMKLPVKYVLKHENLLVFRFYVGMLCRIYEINQGSKFRPKFASRRSGSLPKKIFFFRIFIYKISTHSQVVVTVLKLTSPSI